MRCQAHPTDAPRFGPWLDEAERLDFGVYAAIARTSTPAIDRVMSRLSHAADYSRLSLGSAAVLAAVGGRDGRRGGDWLSSRRTGEEEQQVSPAPPPTGASSGLHRSREHERRGG